MVLKKLNQCGIFNNNEDKNSGETSNDDDGDCNKNILQEFETRFMRMEVLIEIPCEKQIENLQLFVTRSI